MSSKTIGPDVESSRIDSQPFTQVATFLLDGVLNSGTHLKFDPDAFDSTDDELVEDLNWSLTAIEKLIESPENLVFWIRTRSEDFFLTHHPTDDSSKSSGYLRVATFTHTLTHEYYTRDVNLSPQAQNVAGLVTQFQATNAVFDRLTDASSNDGYSLLLTDTTLLADNGIVGRVHPVFDLPDGEAWKFHADTADTLPTDRNRTAFPELVYPSDKYDDEYHHMCEAVIDHVSFADPES